MKTVNLALQGGGAHGAYTWGVLDFMLQDDRLDFEAISGASAGAMNAVALAEGLMNGGREGACRKLHDFWLSVSQEGALTPVQRKLFDAYFGAFAFSSAPAYLWFEALTYFASPYELNPLNLNPLRDHLAEVIDFEKLRSSEGVELLIAASNVFTGKGKIFHRRDLTADHVMASACLPRLFQAVEIKDVPYWDGGYAGNPPLWPLFYETRAEDVIIVQINPIARHETPRTARDILNRIDEITFNTPLLGELRAVNFVNKLIDEGRLRPGEYKRMRLHRIGGDGELERFGAATKLDTSWPFLTRLRDLGRQSAKEWLERHFDDIGVRGTLDLPATIAANAPAAALAGAGADAARAGVEQDEE